jgi:glycosyltransferase involved in cell wall biosynthesis
VSRLRVLFHVTHFRRGGGIETSLLSWLRVLDRERFSVGLSVTYPTPDFAAEFHARIPSDVDVHFLGREAWLSHCRQLKVERRLGLAGRIYEELLLPQVRKRIFRSRIEAIAKGYDLIVDYDMSLARFAFGLGCPLVGISHFSLAQRLGSNRRKFRTAARYFRRYDAIVSICNAMRDEGIRLFPELAERFVTLYPGFDLDEVRARAEAPAEPLTDGAYIVTVTRLEETQKDVGTLILAYALLVKERNIAERLIIVGEGRHRAQLEALAMELGVDSHVVFAGFCSNPLPYMSRARVMALSSKFEGLPTALIEGLALGQVLVASDCPTGPREILNHGEAGLLTPVGDAQALAEALYKALQDSALRLQLQAGARVHAEKFSRSALGSRFSALAEKLRSA